MALSRTILLLGLSLSLTACPQIDDPNELQKEQRMKQYIAELEQRLAPPTAVFTQCSTSRPGQVRVSGAIKPGDARLEIRRHQMSRPPGYAQFLPFDVLTEEIAYQKPIAALAWVASQEGSVVAIKCPAAFLEATFPDQVVDNRDEEPFEINADTVVLCGTMKNGPRVIEARKLVLNNVWFNDETNAPLPISYRADLLQLYGRSRIESRATAGPNSTKATDLQMHAGHGLSGGGHLMLLSVGYDCP